MGISVSQFGYVAVLTVMLGMIAFGVVLIIAVSVKAYKEFAAIRKEERLTEELNAL